MSKTMKNQKFKKYSLHRKLEDPDQFDLRIEDSGGDRKIYGLRMDVKRKYIRGSV